MAKQPIRKSAEAPVAPIQAGEKTKRQTSTVYGVIGNLPTQPGNFKVYRAMRANPTIALARAIANAPIRTSRVSVTAASDTVQPATLAFMQKAADDLWPGYLQDALYARDYGFQAFEKVWEPTMFEGKTYWHISKLKPLSPDRTKPLLDSEHGTFMGLQQDAIKLEAPYCLWYKYDAEPGNWYGRSQHENIRENAWTHWINTARKHGLYAGKVAGVVPMVHYPMGSGKDATGATKDNFDIADAIVKALGNGQGVTIPQEVASWAQDLMRAGVDIEKLLAWRISFLETKGNHGPQFIAALKHYEALMLRGWFVPERAAAEGQYGTRAEATSHASTAMVIAGLVLSDLIETFNWYVLNPLLVYNYGPELENQVQVERVGLDPAQEEFYRELMKAVLGAPANVDLFMTWLDVAAMLDMLGLPASDTPPDGVPPGRVGQEEENAKDQPPELAAALAGIYNQRLLSRMGGGNGDGDG